MWEEIMPHSCALVRLKQRVPAWAQHWRNVGFELGRVQKAAPGRIRDLWNRVCEEWLDDLAAFILEIQGAGREKQYLVSRTKRLLHKGQQ